MRPSCFEWSPDGSQLARAVPRDGNRVAGLELLAVATGQLRYLRYERDDWVPGPLQWSPDGSRIAFLRSGALGIIAADAEMASGLVPSGLPGVGASVSWSPDGRRIAVGTAGTETEAPRFRVMYVDNPGHDFLVFDGRDPVWSPDGKRVAALRGESRSIVILDPDGGGESVISLELPALSGVSWSPDGRRLLYAGGTGEGPVGFVTVSVDTPSDSALVTPITGALGRTTDVDFTWQEVQR
jgi:Tol biopolymer transport system component